MEVWQMLLDEALQLVHAQAKLSHGGLEHLSHPVVLHQLHQHCKCLLLWHLWEPGFGSVHIAKSLIPQYIRNICLSPFTTNRNSVMATNSLDILDYDVHFFLIMYHELNRLVVKRFPRIFQIKSYISFFIQYIVS